MRAFWLFMIDVGPLIAIAAILAVLFWMGTFPVGE